MRKLEVEDAEIMKVAIQQEIIRSEESRYDHRLHGVLLVCAGRSCYEVADLLGHSPRTVEYWVERFERGGFSGLTDGAKQGRASSLDENSRKRLNEELRQSPHQFGYGQNLWDGKLLSPHLEAAHGVRLGVRQCQRLFGDLGFRRRKPRPVIAQADPAAQAEYQKTTAAGSKTGR